MHFKFNYTDKQARQSWQLSTLLTNASFLLRMKGDCVRLVNCVWTKKNKLMRFLVIKPLVTRTYSTTKYVFFSVQDV